MNTLLTLLFIVIFAPLFFIGFAVVAYFAFGVAVVTGIRKKMSEDDSLINERDKKQFEEMKECFGVKPNKN